jgi:hypothetical protein
MRQRLRRDCKRLRREANRHHLPGERIAQTFRSALLTVATRHEQANPTDANYRDQLLQEVEPRLGNITSSPIYRALRDPVVYCYWPDAADREFTKALVPLARAKQSQRGTTILEEMSRPRHVVVVLFERAEVLRMHQIDRHIWSDRNWQMLEHAPPGAITIVYDGTLCGHGVVHAMTLTAEGGAC